MHRRNSTEPMPYWKRQQISVKIVTVKNERGTQQQTERTIPNTVSEEIPEITKYEIRMVQNQL